MGNALQGCAEDPVPGDFLTRVIWYTKRLYVCLRLYRLLMKHDKEKKRKEKQQKNCFKYPLIEKSSYEQAQERQIGRAHV